MTLCEFVQAAVMFCQLTGGSVTSWGRSQLRNRALGGVHYSAHRFFLAVDVVYDDDLSVEQINAATEKNGGPIEARPQPSRAAKIELATRLGLLLIDEGDHDHLQPLTWTKG